MSVRLHFVVEGQTEETFLNTVLKPHLAESGVFCDGHCITTGRKGGRRYRGGIRTYSQIQRDIQRWIRQDAHRNSWFTTMVDLYALPDDFPGMEAAAKIHNPHQRVTELERAMSASICHHRFLPYIQLHEFEALLLAQPESLKVHFVEREREIRRLAEEVTIFSSPEMIDDGNTTAPSKRIIRAVPEYQDLKASAGPIVAANIGLPTLRQRCQHFGEWLTTLEKLAHLT